MEQVICFSLMLMTFRGFEKFLVIDDDYLPFGARVALGIIMSIVDTVITLAMIDEDSEHCKKAYQKAKKAKESFFDYVDGERVVSLHVCAIAIVSKICLWSGLDYWRSFLIPVLVFGVIFVEICTISGDLQKYNETKFVRAQKKGHIGVYVGIDEDESQKVEKSYKEFNLTYAKILGACLIFLRFTFYPFVNDCQDAWSMVNYLILDLLLLFSVIKDYDQIQEKHKYMLVGINLLSLCLYMNLEVLYIAPFYVGTAYLMKIFGKKIFCFVYLFITILLNQYLTWLFHHHAAYQLHFVSKMICYSIFLTVYLCIYKTDRRLLVFAKLFKSAFQLFFLLIVLVLLSELETNSFGTDTTSFKIKQEFAFLALLLCIETWIFCRIHLYYAQKPAIVQPKKPKEDPKAPIPTLSKEEEERKKREAQEGQINILMNKLLVISWKDDVMMKGQMKQVNNFLVVATVVLLNIFFFYEKWQLILMNYMILNRWVYLIKGINDAKLFFWHHLMYVFQFSSKYLLQSIYKTVLVDFIGYFFYWKRNLLTNLALNFANKRQHIDGRSTLLQDGNDFELQFHDVKSHDVEIDQEDLENEIVLTFLLTTVSFISVFKRGRKWKQNMKGIRALLIPLWVYILLFEEYDYYINAMTILQIVQTLDEQFIKKEAY